MYFTDYFRWTVAFQGDHDPATEVEFSPAFKVRAEYYEEMLTTWFENFQHGVQRVEVVALRCVCVCVFELLKVHVCDI